jgi:hypothetical protein
MPRYQFCDVSFGCDDPSAAVMPASLTYQWFGMLESCRPKASVKMQLGPSNVIRCLNGGFAAAAKMLCEVTELIAEDLPRNIGLHLASG